MEVLLSAMHLESWEYIKSLNITSNVIVINQCDVDEIEEIHTDNQNIKFISSTQRGLSRSRNMAIRNADNDVCILCDNDVEYVEDYSNIIENKFSEYPSADVIIFFIKRDSKSAPYENKDCKLNHKTALKVFSPEIAFRRSSLKKTRHNF